MWLDVADSVAAPETVVGDSVEVVEGSDNTVAGIVVQAHCVIPDAFLRNSF